MIASIFLHGFVKRPHEEPHRMPSCGWCEAPSKDGISEGWIAIGEAEIPCCPTCYATEIPHE